MNPSPAFNHEEIDMTWTDEQIIMLLHDYSPELHLPKNVITDSNPFQYLPVNLPEDVWYLLDTGVSKESEFGFWLMKTDPTKIHLNSEMDGWMTTWDYFSSWEDIEPTPWLMQQYSITIGEDCDNQESGASTMLCIIFKSGEEQNPQNEVQVEEEDQGDQGGNQEPEPAVVPEVQIEPEQAPVPEAQDEPEPVPEAPFDLHQEMLLFGLVGFFDPVYASSSSSSCISTITEENLDEDSASEDED